VFIDARTVPGNETIETDVCIVGAGAAGITLAREFINQPFRVCLLESGGLDYDRETQSLYRGENIGLPYFPLEASRLRYFGGTTNHWQGLCRPLDAIDFEARDWVPHSGWPFDKSHLDPFYTRAQSICRVGPYLYDVKDWEADHTPRIPFASDRVITTILQVSPPVRFGKTYQDEIVGAGNIRTYLHANVIDIEATDTTQHVSRLQVACLPGTKFWVRAKVYILAAGGIENARLLLLSNKVQDAGLGNQYDVVGRFFMEHPHLESGLFLPSDAHISVALYSGHRQNNTRITALLSLAPEALRHEKLLNFSAFLYPKSWSEVSKGVSSLRVIVRALRGHSLPDGFLQHLRNVIADIDDVTAAAYRQLRTKGIGPTELISLYNMTEQAPNPNSRVTLSTERDALGKNRVQLNWQLSAIDIDSIRRAHEIIAQELGRNGLGRFKITLDEDGGPWPSLLIGGSHHMGTTRMHVDPHKGVVNEHCQVHGISNLFIAGSSVFPTCGYANPTLTIVALAVRLADHVKGLMR
jgi:choline dehydrogenase-like flavoprotein